MSNACKVPKQTNWFKRDFMSMLMIVGQQLCLCRSFGNVHVDHRIPVSFFEWSQIRMEQQRNKEHHKQHTEST